jgi:hypothetical protein
MIDILDCESPNTPRYQHNKNPAGEIIFYKFTKGGIIQESRSWKWFQEACLGMSEKDKRNIMHPLSRLTLWGIEEFLINIVV